MRAALLILFGLVLAVVLIAVPLLAIQRAECRQDGQVEDEWSIAVPFTDQPRRPRCSEPQSGAERLLEFIRGE